MLADQESYSFDHSHLMCEIHCGPHVSARVVRAVMAHAQVFQVLVNLCNDSPVPLLS
jgi:hypothetical protein